MEHEGADEEKERERLCSLHEGTQTAASTKSWIAARRKMTHSSPPQGETVAFAFAVPRSTAALRLLQQHYGTHPRHHNAFSANAGVLVTALTLSSKKVEDRDSKTAMIHDSSPLGNPCQSKHAAAHNHSCPLRRLLDLIEVGESLLGLQRVRN